MITSSAWYYFLFDLSNTTLFSSILGVLVGAGIAIRQQRHFFHRQEVLAEARARKHEKARVRNILTAFQQETSFNIQLASAAGTPGMRPLFDCHCYAIFKEDFGLLPKDLVPVITDTYSLLFRLNSAIKMLYDRGQDVSHKWARTHLDNGTTALTRLMNKISEFIRANECE